MLVLLTASPAVVTMSNAPYIIAAMQQLRRESHSFVDRELVQVAQSNFSMCGQMMVRVTSAQP